MIQKHRVRLASATAALAALLCASAVSAADVAATTGTYVNDPGHTRLLWRIEHLGLSNYTARFNGVSFTVEFEIQTELLRQ